VDSIPGQDETCSDTKYDVKVDGKGTTKPNRTPKEAKTKEHSRTEVARPC